MGTRSLTVVIHKGEIKVARYGQWDGYPESLGISTLSFLRNSAKVELLKQVLPKVCFFSTSHSPENMDMSRNPGIYFEGNWGNDPEGNGTFRHTAPGTNDPIFISGLREDEHILELILGYKDRVGIILTDAYGFAAESLWCPWAYVTDFDRNTFEVYCGFISGGIAPADRFYHLYKEVSDYYPVKLLVRFPLDQLPGDDEFIVTCRKLLKER
ncbi:MULTISPECIES: hypothetical protein [unclassified Chryseobacterium]|uniref:hypothetical protein n=1 Tax=unclassified Chryseobacterium TaxID=2593645 RepID=UPI000D3C9CCF|nr:MULTISPECIES: hypothetical protein [unclassified Chryseobacterium]PTT66868.1 hypothetical protein DBR25_21885 [Chryseobacterium sp. HMWF001]PVV50441.1 hypothetical protein DD829_22525 [Chryseobacterium sp. HMWF035]